jgi:hypothetical protein
VRREPSTQDEVPVVERKRTPRWLILVVLLLALGCVSGPVGTAVYQLFATRKHTKLADDLHPELQAVAEQPVQCRGGWLGIQIVIAKSDFERVFATVLAMVEAGKIDCEVNIISTDYSVNTYIDPTRRPMVSGDLPTSK